MHFNVVTDHHTVWLQNLRDPAGRLARWVVRLQQYVFNIVHRRGKDHIVPDTLSRGVEPCDVVEDSLVQSGIKDNWYLKMAKKIESSPRK